MSPCHPVTVSSVRPPSIVIRRQATKTPQSERGLTCGGWRTVSRRVILRVAATSARRRHQHRKEIRLLEHFLLACAYSITSVKRDKTIAPNLVCRNRDSYLVVRFSLTLQTDRLPFPVSRGRRVGFVGQARQRARPGLHRCAMGRDETERAA